jgi:hypothetical protein
VAPPVGEPVPGFYEFARAGTYQTDDLGVLITFTNDDDYFVIGRGAGHTLFIKWDADDPLPTFGDRLRSVWFERIGSWYSRAESVDTTYAGLGSIDPYDLDAWVADNAVIVDRTGTTTVGSRPARLLDVRPDPEAGISGPCIEDFVPCIRVSTLSSAMVDSTEHHSAKYPLASGYLARMWLVEMDGYEPVLIRINAPDEKIAWLDEVEENVLPTITFGDPQELMVDG